MLTEGKNKAQNKSLNLSYIVLKSRQHTTQLILSFDSEKEKECLVEKKNEMLCTKKCYN